MRPWLIEAAGEGNDIIETSVDFALADDTVHVEISDHQKSTGTELSFDRIE